VNGETVGFVGLGRMGGPMSRRLVEAGWSVIGVDSSREARARAAATGLTVAPTPSAVTYKHLTLPTNRIV
jgi:3-hydroxyisobutyrate dehydrogenase-like beta-hydroxyacid dehydrogenase